VVLRGGEGQRRDADHKTGGPRYCRWLAHTSRSYDVCDPGVFQRGRFAIAYIRTKTAGIYAPPGVCATRRQCVSCAVGHFKSLLQLQAVLWPNQVPTGVNVSAACGIAH